MKTLLLIDNQDITREGMKTVAGRIGGFAAIKEAGSQSELRVSGFSGLASFLLSV